VADDGPATARREGKVSSTLHGRKTARGELERRSPWMCSRRQRRPDNGGRGARTATIDFSSGDGAIGTSAVGTGEARRFGQRRRRGRNGAVGTPTRGPDNAFNVLKRRGAWQPRGNGALAGGPGAVSDV
jgi:hypothetical protein